MKKNPRLEKRRKSIPHEIELFITKSFDIADRIYEVLQEKNLDQKDLSLLLNKNESEISKWMSGTHNFTLKTISRIESALETTIIMVVSKEKIERKQHALLNDGKECYGEKRGA